MAVELVINASLNMLCGKMTETAVNFRELREVGDNEVNAGNIPGLYAERHVLYVMQKAVDTPGMGTLVIDPIPHNKTTDSHRFLRNTTTGLGIAVKKRGPGQGLRHEYDAVGEADGLPFVIEVKSGWRSARDSTVTRPETIEQRLEPLQDFFGTDKIGLLVAAPEGVFSQYRREQLYDQGGIVVEFPIKKSAFKRGALKVSGHKIAS